MPATRDQCLRRLGRGVGLRRLFGAAGYELVRRHYYSPIPDTTALAPEVFRRRSELRGVSFDIASGLSFLRRELASHLTEYRAPLSVTSDPRRFYLRNGFYEGLDAETLYAMVRHLRPQRIVELGSGFSTLVIADARIGNRGSASSEHSVYDPFPQAALASVLSQVARVRRVSATEVPLEVFAELRAGDILFVDTTHTVKIGGDVNRIVLDVLPTLAPGVIVHFHDIFLPWEYPREFLSERRFFWAEQYLLQAFLAFNPCFEIVFGNYALKRVYPSEIAALAPSAAHARWPSAFWIRRVEAPS